MIVPLELLLIIKVSDVLLAKSTSIEYFTFSSDVIKIKLNSLATPSAKSTFPTPDTFNLALDIVLYILTTDVESPVIFKV